METLADRIRQLGAARGLTTDTAIHQAIGLSKAYLSRMSGRLRENAESGARSKEIQKIAEFFDTTVEYLMTGNEEDRIPDASNDPCPERAAAVSAARLLKHDEAAIQRVLAMDPDPAFSRHWWYKMIEAALHDTPAAGSPRR